MAIDYYHWDSTSSDSDTVYHLGDVATDCTSMYFEVPVTRIWVTTRWDRATSVKFGRLTHEVPGFGWRVEAIIEGDVLLMNPRAEVRTLAQFLPLLRLRSTKEANAALEAFLLEYPEPPKGGA